MKASRYTRLKSSLLLKGLELSAFAEQLQTSRQHLWRVATGRSKNPRIEAAIKDALRRSA